MKRILMRAGMLPFDNFKAHEVISEDMIGTNAGNMLFPYSLSRTLMLHDTMIDSISKPDTVNRDQINEINEKYDCLVLPFANAFRISFKEELIKWTRLVKKLKIPCIVIGIGLQARVDIETQNNFEFDSAVKSFVKAILQKSNIIGVRGYVTGDYLKRLGFIDGKHYMVIGCPSLFVFGDQLPKVSKREFTTESMICFNSRIRLPKKLHHFFVKCQAEYPNHYYIPQNTIDLRLLYAGVPLLNRKKIPKYYPQHADDPIFLEDRVRAFVNVPTWLNFIGQTTLCYGSRIHGNIAGVLAGTPSYIFVHDSRILELAQYHNLPHMLAKDITGKTNLFDLYNSTNFDSIHVGHKERFEVFLNFLRMNDLKTIYDSDSILPVAPFDKRMEAIDLELPVQPFILQDEKTKIKRMEQFYTSFYNQNQNLIERNNLIYNNPIIRGIKMITGKLV